jgi:hypothetical protein
MAGTHNLQDAIYNLKASNLHIVSPPADAGVIDVRGNDGAVVAYNTSSSLAAKLPNETTSPIGLIVYVSNAGSGTITVTDTAGTTIDTVVGSGGEIKGFQLSAARTWIAMGSGTVSTDAINTSLTSIGRIAVPLTSISKEDGTQMIKQATTVTGFNQLANKNIVIQIPANTTAELFAASINAPLDLDGTTETTAQELVLNVVVSKSADVDALTMDAELYLMIGSTRVWSGDIYGGNAVAITDELNVLQFATGNDWWLDGDAQAGVHALAFVLITDNANDSDVVYIHDVYWTYRKKLVS